MDNIELKEMIVQAQNESIDRIFKILVVPVEQSVRDIKSQMGEFVEMQLAMNKQFVCELQKLQRVSDKIHHSYSKFEETQAVLQDFEDTVAKIREIVCESSDKVGRLAVEYEKELGGVSKTTSRVVKSITKAVERLKEQNVITRHPAEIISVDSLLSDDCSELTVAAYKVFQKNSRCTIAELSREMLSKTDGCTDKALTEICNFIRLKYDYVID